jgi:hypothetical protein
MVAFPLLERYLRRASASEPKTAAFNQALLKFIPEAETIERASRFWGVYRHGLLHKAELNRRGDWLSHETTILISTEESFCLNPSLIAQRVLTQIREEFDTFVVHGLPQISPVPQITPLSVTNP